MVRIKDHDSLAGLKEVLTGAFSDAARAAQSMAPAAQALLRDFVSAAEKLHLHEQAFNARARKPAAGTAALIDHLRTPEHFDALRRFTAVKRDLQDHDPALAARVMAYLQAQETTPATAPAAKAAAPKA